MHNAQQCLSEVPAFWAPVTTIECLHRFCAACIEKSLRLGLKECPTCRERCPSRRFLRPDPNFDALIAVIYPDLAGEPHERVAPRVSSAGSGGGM